MTETTSNSSNPAPSPHNNPEPKRDVWGRELPLPPINKKQEDVDTQDNGNAEALQSVVDNFQKYSESIIQSNQNFLLKQGRLFLNGIKEGALREFVEAAEKAGDGERMSDANEMLANVSKNLEILIEKQEQANLLRLEGNKRDEQEYQDREKFAQKQLELQYNEYIAQEKERRKQEKLDAFARERERENERFSGLKNFMFGRRASDIAKEKKEKREEDPRSGGLLGMLGLGAAGYAGGAGAGLVGALLHSIKGGIGGLVRLVLGGLGLAGVGAPILIGVAAAGLFAFLGKEGIANIFDTYLKPIFESTIVPFMNDFWGSFEAWWEDLKQEPSQIFDAFKRLAKRIDEKADSIIGITPVDKDNPPTPDPNPSFEAEWGDWLRRLFGGGKNENIEPPQHKTPLPDELNENGVKSLFDENQKNIQRNQEDFSPNLSKLERQDAIRRAQYGPTEAPQPVAAEIDPLAGIKGFFIGFQKDVQHSLQVERERQRDLIDGKVNYLSGLYDKMSNYLAGIHNDVPPQFSMDNRDMIDGKGMAKAQTTVMKKESANQSVGRQSTPIIIQSAPTVNQNSTVSHGTHISIPVSPMSQRTTFGLK